ncbi:MAG: hypothetical protein P4L90_01865, partial [Rhodopila sp.]|nr:hypothetical protein [Rhodopila sp.]
MQRDTADMNAERADRFEGRAKRQAVRISRKVVGTALALAVCMWSFIGWSLWSEYSVARAAGRTQGLNLAAAIAAELTRTFDAISNELRLIGSNIKEIAPGIPDTAEPERLRLAITAVADPDITVRIAGPDGRLLFSTLGPDPGPAYFSDQPHFIAHRDDLSIGLIVDPPASDAAGKIEVSRRLETSDGRFAGEAMLLLKPGSLITFNPEIDLGRRGVIAVADAGGIVLAAFDRDHPNGLTGAGKELGGAPYPTDLKPGGMAVFTRQDPIANIDRLVSMRRLARYPLSVLVALDLNDVLGSARSHVWLIGLLGVGGTGLIVILTLLLLREVWRRTKREIELAYDGEQLRSA